MIGFSRSSGSGARKYSPPVTLLAGAGAPLFLGPLAGVVADFINTEVEVSWRYKIADR